MVLNQVEQRVCNRIDELEEELLEVLSGLISIDTADPPGEGYDECASYLSRYLKKMSAKINIEQVPENLLPRHPETGKPLSRPNVIGKIMGDEDGSILHFNGHYDIVPAVGEWKTDPFKPKLMDGKLYGRGSSDMKAGLVAAMVAARALRLESIRLGGTISFSFVPDEENDLFAGTKYLVEEEKIGADYCIVCEPTSAANLCNGCKGSLWMEIITRGKAAHGSVPWKGINAFEKMVGVVQEINNKIKPGLLHQGGITLDDETVGKVGAITLGGIVASGESPNVVPSQCIMTVDRRLAPGENLDEVLKGFTSIMKSLKTKDPDFNGDIKVLSHFEAGVTPTESELIQTVKGSIEAVTDRTPKVTVMAGSCDMRYFQASEIPTVIYGPGNMELAHQTDEYVEIWQLVLAAKVYALTAMKLLGIRR